MPNTIRTRSGRVIELPTQVEDAAITTAATGDPDAVLLTDAEWGSVRKTARIGRPPLDRPKKMVSLRLEQDVLRALRGTGPGWQTRVNKLLREALAEGRLS